MIVIVPGIGTAEGGVLVVFVNTAMQTVRPALGRYFHLTAGAAGEVGSLV